MPCDFCSAVDPRAVLYATKSASLILPAPHHYKLELRSNESWLACLECAKYIEAGDREGLARRASDAYPDQNLVTYETALLLQRVLFWNARIPTEVQ